MTTMYSRHITTSFCTQQLQSSHQHEDDYTVWFEWAEMARAQLRRCNNLLDSYVDPVVENHMTLKHKDRCGCTLTGNSSNNGWTPEQDKQNLEEEKAALPPKLIRRSPRKLLSSPTPKQESTDVRTPKRKYHSRILPTAARSTKPSLENVTAKKTPVKNTKRTTQQQLSLWPKLEDVERAFAECSLENSDAVWQNNHSQRTTTRTCEQSKSQRPIQAIATQEEPQPLALHNDPPSPPSLARVSTSIILGQQNKIYQQIQLERQDEYPPYQYSRHSETISTTTTPESRKNTLLPVDFSHDEDSHSHNMNATVRSDGNQHKQQRQQQQQLELHHSPQRRNDKVAVEFTKPTKKSPPRKQKQPHSRPVETQPGVVPHYQIPEQITVPCLECQAPLKISKTPPTRPTGVYCRNCGAMASSELMRSMIGTAASPT